MNRNKRRTVIQKILLALNIIAAAGLLVSYSAAFLSPETFWIIALFGLAYPVFLFLNLIFVLVWLVLWRWHILISLVLILAGWNYLMTYIPLHGSGGNQGSGPPLEMLSFNIHHFYILLSLRVYLPDHPAPIRATGLGVEELIIITTLVFWVCTGVLKVPEVSTILSILLAESRLYKER